jgi:hypothetical protein
MFGNSLLKALEFSPLVDSPYVTRETELGHVFTPLDLPDLTLWLDASDASSMTLNGFGAVEEWGDKSGNGNNAVGSGPLTFKPTYVFNGINHLNCVQFGFSYCYVPTLANLISASTAYMFVAYKPAGIQDNGTPPYNSSAILGELETATNSDIGIFIDNSLETYAYNNDGSDDSVSQFSAGGLSSTFMLYHESGTLSCGVDLNAATSTASGNTTTIDLNLGIGTSALDGGNAPTNPFRGVIGEIIMGNGALSSDDIAAVRLYLYNKWKEHQRPNVYTDDSGDGYYNEFFEFYTE